VKAKREPRTISRPLVQVELPPRKSRHGKPIVTPDEFVAGVRAGTIEPREVGIRMSNRLHVAAGPTQKKGLKNHGVSMGIVPDWWKEKQ